MPGTIDLAKLKAASKSTTKFAHFENLNVILDAARRIGCSVVNLSAEDLVASKPHLTCGLLWQILQVLCEPACRPCGMRLSLCRYHRSVWRRR